MDLKIVATDLNVGFIEIQKMSFINNAIDSGWSVKKRQDKYIFSKKHENKKEVYLETYLQTFIETNLSPHKKAAEK